MKVLHTVKYYSPSKGGMESVVENIVHGVSALTDDQRFIIYGNSHKRSFVKDISRSGKVISVKEMTPLLFRSQPLSIQYKSLRKLIRDADVIHHHYPFPNMELALLRNLDLLKNKRLIITWHANISNSRWGWIGKFYDPIIKKLLNIAEYVVVTSPQLLTSSDILGSYENKVKVIPLSFDPKFKTEHIEGRQFPAERKFKLLFVGKLRLYKGISFLIDAIQDLDVELIVVGDGETENDLKKQVEDLMLTDKVFFHKNISDKKLVTIYREADLFVLPSINEAEAFGVVQVEAMSNGLPVINTNLKSGVPYVSLDGITGITIEPRDSKALEVAIRKLTTNKDLYEKFSKNCIERSKLFTRDKMAQSYLDLYQNNFRSKE